MEEKELIGFLNALDEDLLSALYVIACALECSDQSILQAHQPSGQNQDLKCIAE